jgi:hypothetical protein
MVTSGFLSFLTRVGLENKLHAGYCLLYSYIEWKSLKQGRGKSRREGGSLEGKTRHANQSGQDLLLRLCSTRQYSGLHSRKGHRDGQSQDRTEQSTPQLKEPHMGLGADGTVTAWPCAVSRSTRHPPPLGPPSFGLLGSVVD